MKKFGLFILLIIAALQYAYAQRVVNINDRPLTAESTQESNNGRTSNDDHVERSREMFFNKTLQKERDIAKGDTIVLELFTDKIYKASVLSVEVDITGTYSIVSKLSGYNYAYCFISTSNGRSVLSVEIPEANEYYSTVYIQDEARYFLQKNNRKAQDFLNEGPGVETPGTDPSDVPDDLNDPGKLQEDGYDLKRSAEESPPGIAPITLGNETSTDTVSVLVVYTPAAADWARINNTDINNTISLMMSKANLTLANSNAMMYLQLAHAEKIEYTEQGDDLMLGHLRNSNDGYMDAVHALRDTHCADIVLLLANLTSIGGKAYLLTSGLGMPNYGFSIVRVQQASWTYIGIHEIGHLLGCGHHKEQNYQPGPGLFPYSAGWRFTGTNNSKLCTVMTYGDGEYFADGIDHVEVPYFSNPLIQYSGSSVGDSLSGDNARTIRQTKSVVAGYRDIPPAAGVIAGASTVCQGQSGVTYIVPSIIQATSYLWTLPSGATGTSTTNSITVSYGISAVSGNITVKGTNGCGDGPVSTLPVTVNPLPSAAGVIAGASTVCQGQSGVTYTVPAITHATGYAWTLPGGATGTSTTNSITVSYGISAVSGSITVKGTNACGNGPVSTLPITVNPLPAAAGVIAGASTVCQGQSGVTYTVPAITNATGYLWTLPGGATGTSTTNSITVSYGLSAVSGNITVRGTNACGDGPVSALPITVNPLPAAAGVIAGASTGCQGQSGVTYTVPAITHAIGYVWTLPGGATGTSTSNSITVSYGISAASGTITVKGTNVCGNGVASEKVINVNPKPVTPTISIAENMLKSDTDAGNQWYSQNGAINGAAEQFFKPTSNGEYFTIVTLLGCSSDASNIVNYIITGLESNDEISGIKVYPNPFNDWIMVESEGEYQLSIINIMGHEVYNKAAKNSEILQLTLPPGLYTMVIQGSVTKTVKIIKY